MISVKHDDKFTTMLIAFENLVNYDKCKTQQEIRVQLQQFENLVNNYNKVMDN